MTFGEMVVMQGTAFERQARQQGITPGTALHEWPRAKAKPSPSWICIDPNRGYSRSLEKLMHNKKLVRWRVNGSECVGALMHRSKQRLQPEFGNIDAQPKARALARE
jgi:hypothetical protein